MNKKGDVPTIMLFIVAIVLSVSALFVMVSFGNDFPEKSEEFSNLMGEIEFVQDYVYNIVEGVAMESIDCDSEVHGKICDSELEGRFKEILKQREIHYMPVEIVINQIIEKEDIVFDKIGNKHLIEIDDLILEVKLKDNVVKRRFDLILEIQ